ncbi:hypothetical protein AMJ74_00855 [candidate division WOR_3 bacterium SM1_77]|uniref:Glycosyltransferase subfamily 4-like N-terminal domain-containing protein n=1 Tax=candidate division WOR_3 bacterium SM1_77 TaxID=1703778 RepID=A0A0S8K475_UNCW3|nr:MAG: hypothetical protein AMJ74_00855 [candidate division WOR_3 bacterium SM1_77]
MKICYLANAASVHTQRWARHFADRGCHVSIVSFQPGEIGGVEVFTLPPVFSRPRVDVVLNLGRIRRLVRRIAPDILHAHYVTSYGLAGAISGWRPFIATAWGDDVLVAPEESLLYRLMVRWALSRADLVTSMAEHMTAFMNRRHYSVPDKIVTLPFGVDTQQFCPSCRTRRHGELPARVISTRHLEDEYDVQTLIRAIPTVVDRCPGTQFVVVGDGGLRPFLENLAVDLGVRQYTEFLGKVPHEHVSHLLGRADVFVTTSTSDGNNISLNEAMACGAFPVATDIPANRAWIEHRKNGLLFSCRDSEQLADAIIEALWRPDWRQDVMDQNWEIVCTRASWSHSMVEMERHYFRLLQEERI